MRIFLFICFIAISVSAAQKATMVLQWEHQSQFAGYYMALEKGFYAEEDLDVTLVRGGADVNPLELVKDGKADFCSAMLMPILAFSKDNQTKFCLLSQVINRSTLSLVAWKDGKDGYSNIQTPSDLNGKTITVWEGFADPFQTMFNKFGIKAKIIPQYYSFSLFLQRGADACSAMLYNEYHSLLQFGIKKDEIIVFDFYELGINIPEDGIYCLKKTEEERPDFCQSFAQASMKGWAYAKEHPEETLNVVMKYVKKEKLPTNRPHMKWMLDTILGAIYPEKEGDWIPGKLNKSDFNNVISMLKIDPDSISYEDFVAKEAQNVQN
ncbi:MAG: ABC transporter substrate-binding protein [Kiritimatiellae bacterium]|jgi:NitT/TauT family transport system substrate-binding protein|nr:ABC transporter substrate-binding protein [Kiritimatiellia bacterium]